MYKRQVQLVEPLQLCNGRQDRGTLQAVKRQAAQCGRHSRKHAIKSFAVFQSFDSKLPERKVGQVLQADGGDVLDKELLERQQSGQRGNINHLSVLTLGKKDKLAEGCESA